MSPLTYTRLIKGLNSLSEKANNDLSGPAFVHHRNEILRVIDDGIASAESGLARNSGALFPGQIKHWIGERVDDILKGVVPPTATHCAALRMSTTKKRITRSTAATGSGIEKQYDTRGRSSASTRGGLSTPTFTRADIECATTLLNAGTSTASTKLSSRISTFGKEDIECATTLLELAMKPVVFAKRAPIPVAPASKDFWSVIG